MQRGDLDRCRDGKMPANIQIQISPGELVDRLTILEIKLAKISDPAKRANVAREHELTLRAAREHLGRSPELEALAAELRKANSALWDIEDAIRACERAGDFGERFVALARSIYRTNDRRAALKRRINELMQSDLVEEKSYTSY
jgi:hypothetical protein